MSFDPFGNNSFESRASKRRRTLSEDDELDDDNDEDDYGRIDEDERRDALEQVRLNWRALAPLSDACKDDKEIVLAAIDSNQGGSGGGALRYASERLRNDPEVIRCAVHQQAKALLYASREARDNPEFILELVKEVTPEVLRYATFRVKNHRETVLQAVRQDGDLLQYASDSVRADVEVVYRAVKNHPAALKYVATGSDPLDDSRVVVAAIRASAAAESSSGAAALPLPVLAYASPRLRQDPRIVRKAVKWNGGKSLQYASEELRACEKIVTPAVENHPMALVFAAEPLRNNVQLALSAVSRRGDVLQHLSDDMRSNRQVVMAAVQQWGGALRYALDSNDDDAAKRCSPVREDPMIVAAAIDSASGETSLLHGLWQEILTPGLAQRIRDTAAYCFGHRYHYRYSYAQGQNNQRDGSDDNDEKKEKKKATAVVGLTKSTEGLREYAERVWKHPARKKIWLLQQALQAPRNVGGSSNRDNNISMSSGIGPEQQRIILEYMDIRQEFQKANELIHLAPIFAAFANQGFPLHDLPL